MNAGWRSSFQTLPQIGLAVFIHEKTDGPEVHPIDGNLAAKIVMQRLQHEAVAAKRDNHRRIVAGIAVGCPQLFYGELRLRRVGRGEMNTRSQCGGQPPVSDICRATAGRLCRRSMMKSCPLGLRAIASSIAASSTPSSLDERSTARRSAESSWPRHI